MLNEKDDIRVYTDLEYCYPDMARESGRPGEDQLRQVVQISAILWDTKNGKEVAAFDMLTHPAFEKELPLFFIELTGITSEMMGSATTFKVALEQFKKFADGYSIWTFNADWGVLKQNCAYFDIPFPFQNTPFIKVKSLLPKWGIDPDAYSSGTLYQAAKLNMSGHIHNALHDVRSMASAVHYFET